MSWAVPGSPSRDCAPLWSSSVSVINPMPGSISMSSSPMVMMGGWQGYWQQGYQQQQQPWAENRRSFGHSPDSQIG